MNEQTYKKMVSSFKENKLMRNFLIFSNKLLPLVFYISYPVLLIVKGCVGLDRDFIRMLIVPTCVFLGVTIMRKLIDRPRPYEKFGFPPVIDNDKKGESFPSRHTASAFIIALSAFCVSPILSVILGILALIISVSRVLAGIHFISDVLFGASLSFFFGILFFFII